MGSFHKVMLLNVRVSDEKLSRYFIALLVSQPFDDLL